MARREHERLRDTPTFLVGRTSEELDEQLAEHRESAARHVEEDIRAKRAEAKPREHERLRDTPSFIVADTFEELDAKLAAHRESAERAANEFIRAKRAEERRNLKP